MQIIPAEDPNSGERKQWATLHIQIHIHTYIHKYIHTNMYAYGDTFQNCFRKCRLNNNRIHIFYIHIISTLYVYRWHIHIIQTYYIDKLHTHNSAPLSKPILESGATHIHFLCMYICM